MAANGNDSSNDTLVAPFMRLVPNGVRNGKLMVVLIVTPQKVQEASTDKLKLSDWPDEIARVLSRSGEATFKLRVGLEDPAPGNAIQYKTVTARFRAPPVVNAEVVRLWQRAIEGGGLPAPWSKLLEDIDRSMAGNKHTAALNKSDYAGSTALPSANSFTNAGAIVASSYDPTRTTTVTGVVPNAQAQYATETEAARAQRIAAKLVVGPYLPGDLDDESNSQIQDRADDKKAESDMLTTGSIATADPGPIAKQLTEARRQKFFDRLKSSIDATKDLRARSYNSFNAVRGLLDASVQAVPPAASSIAPASIIAPRAHVLGQATTTDRASHIYGTWTQRSSAAPRSADPVCPAPDPLARLHGVYYSLQGDPILSRFFGFMFDLEIDLKDAGAITSKDQAVWLTPDQTSDQLWTKTAYHKSGAGEHFWPASRFDKSSPPGAAFAVEQTHGVFNLSLSYDPQTPANGPRYDLTSLDVRGAVSVARDARDLGHRHRTIGWTLLDRGRADQVARDLAIYDRQIDQRTNNKPVVLCAEELTIGRRLDIAATRDGAPVKDLVWRSLMNRFVAFTHLKEEARKQLRRVADVRPDGQILDEGSFQLMARSMPLVGPSGSAQNVEAIVEEAIQTWDGTPLAALACKADSSGGNPACDLPPPVLPIKRTYDLPHDKQLGLRPPPLRYGVGYIFSIRSVFLGGGSPTAAEAGTLHQEMLGAWTLPPGRNKQAHPRRYLRHEGIDAPILMLPRWLVEKRYGKNDVMGFEPPGHAVVRSRVVAPPPPGAPNCVVPQLATKDPGPDYVPAIDRAAPDETLRVFVAPMVGFDFASRHRVFDDAKTADTVIRGGLLDVDFGDPDHKGPRFPVGVIKRNTGFNGERLIYSRKGGWPRAGELKEEDTDGLGATLFSPQSKATRAPAQGYLPDPAAQRMSFRLRVSGADNYLDGDLCVDLYKDKDVTYPNALPVAVTIKKVGPRKELATKVSDVISGDLQKISRLDKHGKFRTDASGVGVRVRHLTIELAPGEQFDVEVTCLPTPKKLSEWFSMPETMGVQHLAAQDQQQVMTELKNCCGALPLLAEMKAASAKPAVRAGLNGKAPPDAAGLALIANKLLDCIQHHWPLTELASPTTLHVAHAINLPSEAPSLNAVKILRPASAAGASPPSGQVVSPAGTTPSNNVGQKTEACPAQSPPANCSSADFAPGATGVLLSGEILVDLEQADTIDIVATVVNASGKPFDDPTRGRGILAKRTGEWPRTTSVNGSQRDPIPNASVFGFDVGPDGKTRLLREVITLLRIQNLPDPRAAINGGLDMPQPFKQRIGRLTPLDLRVLHNAAITGEAIEIPIALPKDAQGPDQTKKPYTRKLSITRPHELTDTKARELELHAVGLSRFAAAFATAPHFSEDGQEHVLHRRQPLRPQEQSNPGKPVIAWSLSTERPAACAAKTPTPFFSTKRCAKHHGNGVMQNLDREAGVRLRFDRGMFSSGQGERIAVVLWPPNNRDQSPINLDQNWINFKGRWMQLSSFEDADLGDGGKFISRWGGDPIRSDPEPQTSFFMPWSAFTVFENQGSSTEQPHSPCYVPRARMPVCAPPTDDGNGGNKPPVIEGFLDVSLLSLEPYFDVEREEWFVDVPMKLARATDPFIRFGLVRYQPNAISDDLKVSTPIRVWTQLPSHRHVSVTHEPVDKTADIAVRVQVRGQASDGVKPIPNDLLYLLQDPTDPKAPKPRDIWQRLQRPKMTLRLVHESTTTNVGRHQTDVLRGALPSAMPNPIDGEMVWTLLATVSASRIKDLGAGRLFAIVEETEERLAASYAQEPIALANVLTPESIRESGPRFMARIPFLDV